MSDRRPAASRPALEPLTGLRFVAALAVVLYHLPLGAYDSSVVARLSAHGYLGVSLFFVLSGFILTYTYIDPDTGALRGTARAFWWARAARIYPVYALGLLLSAPAFIVFRLLFARPEARPSAVLAAGLTPLLLQAWWPRTATQWNIPGWSLSVEVVFYAIFPVLAVWLARRRMNPVALGVIAWLGCLALPLAYLVVAPDRLADPTRADQGFWLHAVKFNPLAHVGEFAVGVVAGLAFLRRAAGSFIASAWFARLTSFLVVALAVMVATTRWFPYVLLHDGLLAPLWAAVILSLAAGGGRAGSLLGSRALVRLGEASFALYLVHIPLLGYMEFGRGFMRMRHPGAVVPAWVPLVGYVLAAVALSRVIFVRVEEPARRRIRRWALREAPPVPTRTVIAAPLGAAG